MPSDPVVIGAQALLEQMPDAIAGKNVGLITNHTGVMPDVEPLVEVLIKRGVRLKALFGPEHGIRGEVADGRQIESGVDSRTGIPVFSLYGATRKPTQDMLEGLDVLMFDIQDVGVRFYTFLWTMAHCLEAAAERGLPFYVLDRPNPIRGDIVAGPVLDPEFSSFVGLYPVPTRLGMTVGEVARFVAARLEQGPAALRVIKMRNWKRSMWYDETGLPWVMPSPNMPTLETAIVYPGTCIFEGTNLSEGRGMMRPFETIGAPWVQAEDLADALNELKLPGARFRPTYFSPLTSKHKGTACGGVQLHVMDRNTMEPITVALEMLTMIRKMHPDQFQFRQPADSGRPYIDLLTGGDMVRKMVLGGRSAREIAGAWMDGLKKFEDERRQYLLYEG